MRIAAKMPLVSPRQLMQIRPGVGDESKGRPINENAGYRSGGGCGRGAECACDCGVGYEPGRCCRGGQRHRRRRTGCPWLWRRVVARTGWRWTLSADAPWRGGYAAGRGGAACGRCARAALVPPAVFEPQLPLLSVRAIASASMPGPLAGHFICPTECSETRGNPPARPLEWTAEPDQPIVQCATQYHLRYFMGGLSCCACLQLRHWCFWQLRHLDSSSKPRKTLSSATGASPA